MSSGLQVRTSGGPGRCAWCHDDVRLEERTACAACLAVHHSECWSRERRCAACQGLKPLTASGAAVPTLDPVLARVSEAMLARSPALATRAIIEGSPELRAIHGRCVLGIILGLVSIPVLLGITRGSVWSFAPSVFLVAGAGLLDFLRVQQPAQRELERLRELLAHATRAGPPATSPKEPAP